MFGGWSSVKDLEWVAAPNVDVALRRSVDVEMHAVQEMEHT